MAADSEPAPAYLAIEFGDPRIREGRLMGGMGSGRSAWRNVGTVEGRISLDVGRLHREGALRLGVAASWRWNWGEGSTASITSVAQVGAAGSLG